MESDYNKKHINKINKTARALLLAVLFFNLACTSNKPEEIKAIEADQNTPSLELVDFETFISDSGMVKYHVTTPLLLNYDKAEEPYKEYPQGGHIMTYDSVGSIQAQIKCKYAIFYDKQQLWDLRNNVEAVNEDGVVFNTEQLFWNQSEKKIYTEKFIKITTTDEIITGYGFTAKENLTEYRLNKMSGTIALDEKQQTPE
ncbi:LPS export ABC transporter protein LptC [Saccharicrinis carchari]|uniref:LPS export ABC transporter protein LptC n=1 Tax=Saccharicrinis carchari TaxID=1168039 RepID=A0A521D4M1_SACCC|nr:LPS export ABC transporter periplasmic protein LptC [Saccharicrinis carchari]SMO66638.1 LPS export ABC transporter protein LptC [Saccharicrinis carchari]